MLQRAISSVLQQTYKNFELIIVDDASTDETKLIVSGFQDDRIIYQRRIINEGASAARNSGIRAASGKYISFLDDDDEFLPHFLAETYHALEIAGNNIGFSWTEQYQVQDTSTGEKILCKRTWHPELKDPRQRFFLFLKSLCIGTSCGLTVRRTCFDTVGLFDESFTTGEDTDFLIRLSRYFDFTVVPKILIKVHNHSGPRLYTSSKDAGEIYEKILYKNLPILKEHPDLLSYFNYKIGWWHYNAGKKRRGRHFMLRALRIYPWQLKPWFFLPLFEFLGAPGMRLYKRLINRF